MERVSRGDIWTVELVAHPKPRPALILSIDPVNDLCPDVLLISGPQGAISSESTGQRL